MTPARRLAAGFAALIVTVAACGGPRPPAPDLPQSLRLATWNIEWLGQPDKRASKQLQSPNDIAAYLAANPVDLLCVNEVSRDEVAGGFGRSTILTKALEIHGRATGSDWQHLLFPKDDPTEADQLVGVCWDAARVRLVGEPWRVPVRKGRGQGGLFRRHPFAAKFSTGEGRTDLVVIPVHLKSNAGDEAGTTVRQRAEEAKVLVRALGEVQNHFSDDDVVVLGDCNCLTSAEAALVRLRATGLRDLNTHDEPTWIRSARFEPAPFDRIFVPDDQPEFATAALRVCRLTPFAGGEAEFRQRLSDHYMVRAEVNITADDD
jgi:endonuclease/exonuclease/phosphatase family metal-dependent hydrolase